MIINFAFRGTAAGTASAATCANARAGTATTVAAGTTAANPCRALIRTVRCVFAVRAIAAVGRVAARGTDCALAYEEERVARCHFDAGTGTRGTVGIGSRAGDGHALGQVEIHVA